MKTLRTFIIAVAVLCGVISLGVVRARAQDKNFTTEELAQFDGRSGHKAYFAYKGKVYDVTDSSLWKLGEHFGLHAGFDLTGKMEGAPHGEEVLSRVPVVGTFGIAQTPVPTANAMISPTPPLSTKNTQQTTTSWYDAPIRIAGVSLLGWTGILLAVTFTLNFLTCFALPWKNLPVPWSGSRPGPDALDVAPKHQNLASIHKYFAWSTVVIGILHGVLGLMQVFFKMYL